MDIPLPAALFGQPILWTLLWSDLLMFVLTSIVLIMLWRMKPAIRQRWHAVLNTRTGMVTGTIILCYVAIALLDCLHYRTAVPATSQPSPIYYHNHVHSALDIWLRQMADNDERTYSAPFALTSWTKENRIDENGQRVRDYPPLQHGGAHLEHQHDKTEDLLWRTFVGISNGLELAVLFIVLHWLYLTVHSFRHPDKTSTLPWYTAWLTLALVLSFLGALVYLSEGYHVLGTDQSGNDTLYKSLKGIRTAVLIGTLTTLITLPIALVLGTLAGYFRGWVDDVIQYVYTTLISIPGLLLTAASVLLFQVWVNNHPALFEVGLEKADARFLGLCFILGITSWTTLCRQLRAETLKLSQLDYVQAARAFGVPDRRIIRQHILPNLSHMVIIAVVLDFSGLVLAEAVLSYIGVGVDPAMASWGNMINLASSELAREPTIWWNLCGAFFFMFTLVLCVNLFADLVNDAFNPKGLLERDHG